MRIGIDCRTILNPGYGERAGVGHYTYFLVKNLLRIDAENTYVLFFDDRITDAAIRAHTAGAPNVEVVRFPFHEYRHALPGVYSHLLLSAFIAKQKPDVFHLPAGTMPAAYRGRTVVTIHDLAIYHHPEWFPKQALSTKVLYPKTVRSATRIIAVSDATREDAEKRFRIPAARIRTIYPGVDVRGSSIFSEDILSEDDSADSAEVRARHRLDKPYILFLGTLEPRKNISGLVRAFLTLWMKDPRAREFDLIIAGARGWKEGETVRTVESARRLTRGAVRWIGYIPHREKFTLMRQAAVFCFPTFFEGFGMPVLEALALGVPVIASDIPVLREVAGPAAMYVPPGSEDEMAHVLSDLLHNESRRDVLRGMGLKRAAHFSWEKASRETLDVYRAAVRG